MVADLPAWLHDALSGFEPPPRPAPRPAGAVPKPGEIVLANSLGDDSELSRLVAVVDVHPRTYSVVALLISNRVEDRTAADFLAEPDETGLPYPVVIQSDIVGALFENQLSHPHGALPDELMGAIRRVQASGSAGDDDGRRGLPLRSRLDPRWEWKESEIDEMQRLAATCTETLLAPGLVDPAMLEFEGLAAEELEETCLAIAEALGEGMALPAWAIERSRLFDEVTLGELRDLGSLDALVSINELLIDAIDRDDSVAPDSHSVAIPDRRTGSVDDPLGRVVHQRAERGIPVTRTATLSRLWRTDVASRVDVRVEGTVAVIVPELIEV